MFTPELTSLVQELLEPVYDLYPNNADKIRACLPVTDLKALRAVTLHVDDAAFWSRNEHVKQVHARLLALCLRLYTPK